MQGHGNGNRRREKSKSMIPWRCDWYIGFEGFLVILINVGWAFERAIVADAR